MSVLKNIIDMEIKADNFGFRWENPFQILDQIESECREIRDELQINKESTQELKIQEEIGDLMHAVFSLCHFCGFDPEQTLKNTTEKFSRRLEAVKKISNESGLDSLNGKSFDELMSIWEKAKKIAG